MEHFLRQLSAGCSHAMHGFSTEAMEALQRFSWPGNVRELRNTVEVALATCTERYGRLAHLPAGIVREMKRYTAPRWSDRETLLEALRVVNLEQECRGAV